MKHDYYGSLSLVVPENAPEPPKFRNVKQEDGSFKKYPITHLWPYHNAAGELLFYVARYETEDKKETLQITMWNKSGTLKWNWKWYRRPLPIYNQHLLARYPDAQVVVVEGEKCADALQHLIDESEYSGKFVATTAPGGTSNYNKADWSPLEGRKVVLWEDHDLQCYKNTENIMPREQQPGHCAMLVVAGFMKNYCVDCRMVNPYGENNPPKWDVADAILINHWSMPDVLKYIKSHVENIPENVPIPEEVPEPEYQYNAPLLSPEEKIESCPFKCLGYDHDHYFYMSRSTRQVKILTASEHTEKNLTSLADLKYWERMYPSKSGPIWRNAVNVLFRSCERMGIYDVARIRGRGAWVDNGRVVLHLGDKLLVNNSELPLDEIESKYVYEHGGLLNYDKKIRPLNTAGAHKLLKICDSLTWEREIYSRYFAGWLVLAPICGALNWRPHLWITAKSGTGKTWIIDHILKPCLGNFKLSVQSNTTEAAIRQKLKCDSLPVTFDEIENENVEANKRIQHILELSRQASSETDTGILKGSQTGRAIEYKIRSMFLFSSIAVSLSQQADISRITVVSLKTPEHWEPWDKESHFDKLQDDVNTTITDEWCSALRARSIQLIPVILENSKVFARAAAKVLGTQRAGDQVGTLLAGAYSLSSSSVIDTDTATDWILQREWEEEQNTVDTDDSVRCLETFLQHIVRVNQTEVNISNLLYCANETKSIQSGMEDINIIDAVNTLAKCGISASYEAGVYYIFISNNHTYIKNTILSKSPWTIGWHRILRRLPNTITLQNRRFAGVQSRCVGVPWDNVFN